MLVGRRSGELGRNELVLSRSGIGKVNAAVGALRLIEEEKPDCVVSSGVAGGIDDSLELMDVVVATETGYHDVWCGEGNEKGQVQGLPARFESNEVLWKAAIGGREKGVKSGLILTGDQFITTKEELRRIKEAFPTALAVDMESAAIAQVCYIMGVPFLSMRIVSDTPGTTEDHFAQYQDFWKELSECSFRKLRTIMEEMPGEI